MLPSYAAGAGDLFDLVAAGADALPCYRYLCARLAIETSLALAKHERMPEVALPVAQFARPAVSVPEAPPLPPSSPPSPPASTSCRGPAHAGGTPTGGARAGGARAGGARAGIPRGDPAQVQPDADGLEEDLEELLAEEPKPPPAPLAPPAPPAPPVQWPTAPLPEAHRLRGMFLAGNPPGEWRISR